MVSVIHCGRRALVTGRFDINGKRDLFRYFISFFWRISSSRQTIADDEHSATVTPNKKKTRRTKNRAVLFLGWRSNCFKNYAITRPNPGKTKTKTKVKRKSRSSNFPINPSRQRSSGTCRSIFTASFYVQFSFDAGFFLFCFALLRFSFRLLPSRRPARRVRRCSVSFSASLIGFVLF